MKKKIYIDMDGVLAKWQVATHEELLQKDYFLKLPENETLCEGIRRLCKLIKAPAANTEVYVLSTELEDSKHAIADKNAWLDEHLPCIPADHRIFTPDGDKVSAALRFTGQTELSLNDYLLDDYTPNLLSWKEAGGCAIKVFNNVNGNTNPWDGEYICTAVTANRICGDIVGITMD